MKSIAMLKGMSIRFDKFSATAPSCSWIGFIGHGESGISEALDLGTFTSHNLSALAVPDRLRWIAEAERVRRSGGVVLAAASDPEVFRDLADEVWWLENGKLRMRGEPREVIAAYMHEVYLGWGTAIEPSMRRGDGRAEILSIEILDSHQKAHALIQSGQPAAIRVVVRYAAPVADPVIGIMIRTRIGFEVYGTNTELEKLKLGPVRAGENRTVTFYFDCQLCPQSYTITAASHDPNGVWHEWMEDAISFTVADSRYTAGVANLRARAELS